MVSGVMLFIMTTLTLPFIFQRSCEKVQICTQSLPLNEVITSCRTFLVHLMITLLVKEKFSMLLWNTQFHYRVDEPASRST